MKLFIEGEFNLPIDDHINSLILSQASDIAERLTELDCKILGIKCYIVEMEGKAELITMTDKAQDIFNEHYDLHTSELYALLNAQIKTIQENK